MQVVGGLVEEGVVLSDKLSPDQLGTWLLHHHFFGQLEISGQEADVGLDRGSNPRRRPLPVLQEVGRPPEAPLGVNKRLVKRTANLTQTPDSRDPDSVSAKPVQRRTGSRGAPSGGPGEPHASAPGGVVTMTTPVNHSCLDLLHGQNLKEVHSQLEALPEESEPSRTASEPGTISTGSTARVSAAR